MAQKRCFGCMQLKENSPVCEHCGFNEFAQNESHQLPLGTVLRNQYLVGKCLGQGGFGITYLGWDLNLDIPIAIKEYYPNSIVNRDTAQSLALTGVATNMMDLYVSTRQRFLREAKVLAMLRNVPNIVQVHNFFEENNTAYIIMEYVKGIDLRRYMNLRGGRLSVDETLAILKPVMQALQRVHDFEIVHRDISPDNIMMMPDGTAKLLDFGAVRNVESADAEQELQHSTEAILKHGFAPMEQYQKRGALGPWTDEYAMCATVYYCLTGRVPPDAPQRMMEDVHPAWEKIPGLSPQQIQVLEKGMSLRAKDRYASVSDLMEALYGPDRTQSPVTSYVPEPVPVTRAVDPIDATEPVEPAAAQTEEAEIPAYTAPMMTAPVEHVELPVQKKKGKGGLIAGLAVVAVLLVAGFVALGILPKPEVHTPPATEAPVITTEAPETTAPAETTEATEPLPIWYDNVLMKHHQDYRMGADTAPAFGTDITKVQVKTITFRDSTAGAPDSAWDASETQDGSVLVWYEGNDYYKDLIIAADGGINAKNTVCMFSEYQSLESVDFGTAFHTDYAVSFAEMFDCCTRLKEVDLSSFQTVNLTNISCMFAYCNSLKEVNVSGWDVSKVTIMNGTFMGCKSLKELDASGWDISRVEGYVGFMDSGDTINGKPWEEFFKNPPAVTAVNTENDAWKANVLMAPTTWKTRLFGTEIASTQVKTIAFRDSTAGAPADAYDVSEAQDGSVLMWCENEGYFLKDMIIAADGGINAKNTAEMFRYFSSLESIDFGDGFHTDYAVDFTEMFLNCENLKALDLSGFQTGNVTHMTSMFDGCNKLSEVNVSNWDVSNVTNMRAMFQYCHSLTLLDLSAWDVSNVTTMDLMFKHCKSLKKLDLPGWDVSKVEHYGWFMDSGDTINGKPWVEFFQNKPGTTASAETDDAWRANVLMAQPHPNTGYDNNKYPAFGTPIIRNSVKTITFLDTLKDAPAVNCWDVSEAQDGSVKAWVYQSGDKYDMYIAAEGGINAKHCDFMFYAFINLERIDFGNALHTDEATSMHVMFWCCEKLNDLGISGFNTGKVADMFGMFENCWALTNLDLSSWDTSNVTNMHSMFHNCYNLTEINVSGWDTSQVTQMTYMFQNCNNLTEIDLSGWDISKVELYGDFMDTGDTINGKPWMKFFM